MSGVGTGVEEGRLLPIGRVAALADVSERTLHYYEQIGLLTPADRDPGCRRQYTLAALDRLAHIRELQDVMGYSLKEIQAIMEAEDRMDRLRAAWHDHPDPARQRRLLDEALTMTDAHRQRVSAKAERLGEILARLDAKTARYRQLAGQLEQGIADRAPEPAARTPDGG